VTPDPLTNRRVAALRARRDRHLDRYRPRETVVPSRAPRVDHAARHRGLRPHRGPAHRRPGRPQWVHRLAVPATHRLRGVLRGADPLHMARHGCRPSGRPSMPRPAPARRGSTNVSAPSARCSAGWCRCTSRPGWHSGASAISTACRSRVTSNASCAAISTVGYWPAASPAPAAAMAATSCWSRSPARAAG
jgi:hypothetical protein